MMTVTSDGASVKLDFGDGAYAIHPHASLIAISDESDIITFRLVGSRKTLYQADYTDITPNGSDAAETVETLNLIL